MDDETSLRLSAASGAAARKTADPHNQEKERENTYKTTDGTVC